MDGLTWLLLVVMLAGALAIVVLQDRGGPHA